MTPRLPKRITLRPWLELALVLLLVACSRPPSPETEVRALIAAAVTAAEEVARRETLEEAGCVPLELAPICRYLVSPGGTSESITLFCGRVDAASVTSGVHGLASEHEDIRVRVVSRAEALDLLRAGRINSAAPIIALQWLELNRSKLLERWGNGAV